MDDGSDPSSKLDGLRNLAGAGDVGLDPEACAVVAVGVEGISFSSCNPAGCMTDAEGRCPSSDGRPPKLKLFLSPDKAFSANALVEAT